MKTLKQYIHEARIIDPFAKEKQPLKNSDTIRVYHGTGDYKTLFQATMVGLSGGTRANRRYSYESNNNPYGLFVTPSLKVAKEFGDYIIEFHAKVSDLEAPVWPGGSFTVQGGMTKLFKDDSDRQDARKTQKQEISDDEKIENYIRQSDSPDVAYWLFSYAESQALFVGDLNKNSIRAIWVPKNPQSIVSSYTRMNRKQFVRMAEKTGIRTRFNTITFPNEESHIEHLRKYKEKIFEPKEDASLKKLLDILTSKYKLSRERIINILKTTSYIENYVWNDRQKQQLEKELQKL
jgi:hypothetical protein